MHTFFKKSSVKKRKRTPLRTMKKVRVIHELESLLSNNVDYKFISVYSMTQVNDDVSDYRLENDDDELAENTFGSDDNDVEDVNDSDSDYDFNADNFDSDDLSDILILLDGLHAYLTSSTGGGMSPSGATTALNRMAKFVLFVSQEVYGDEKKFCSMRDIIIIHHSKIARYCEYMTSTRAFTPSTVLGHLDNFLSCVQWYVMYRPCSEEELLSFGGRLDASTLHPWETTTKHIRKVFRKANTIRNSKKTVESELNDHRLPIQGIAEIQRIVDSRMAWAKNLTSESFQTKGVYNSFMQLFYASMFSSCVQGR